MTSGHRTCIWKNSESVCVRVRARVRGCVHVNAVYVYVYVYVYTCACVRRAASACAWINLCPWVGARGVVDVVDVVGVVLRHKYLLCDGVSPLAVDELEFRLQPLPIDAFCRLRGGVWGVWSVGLMRVPVSRSLRSTHIYPYPHPHPHPYIPHDTHTHNHTHLKVGHDRVDLALADVACEDIFQQEYQVTSFKPRGGGGG